MTDATVNVEAVVYGQLYDPDGVGICDPDSVPIYVLSGWVNINRDVRIYANICYSTGNPNNDIEARVADDGVLTLVLDNSQNNSVGLSGYYSPDNTNVRTLFEQNLQIRINIVYGATTYYQWKGLVKTIQPSSGEAYEQITFIEAVDYMHYFYDTDFTNVNIQTNKRDDELLTTLVSQLPVAPENTDYDTGNDQYTYAFHDEIAGTSHIISVIQRMMMSGLGKIYIRGGTTYSETLTYINRANLLNPGAAVAALDDNMIGLEVIRDESSLIKRVNVTTYPVQVDTSDVILWQLNEQITLDPGTSKTFTMYLRDPDGRATKVAALSLVDPVADTDYKFSSVSGSGNDLNADLVFSYSDGTNSFDVTVTNSAAVTGYLWYFFPRGKGLYLYEPTTTSKLTGQTYGKTLNINMIYQEDVNVGRDIATILADWYSVARSNISAVKIIANTSATLMTAALTVQPGDYVTIKETQTGIDTGFIVNGIDTEINAADIIYKTWYLCQAQIIDAFILDVDLLGVGILGV